MTLRVTKFVCLAILVVAVAVIVFSALTGWSGLWNAFNVPTMSPIFADLRTIPIPSEIPADISLRHENPIDPGALGNSPGQSVFPPAAADDQHVHCKYPSSVAVASEYPADSSAAGQRAEGGGMGMMNAECRMQNAK